MSQDQTNTNDLSADELATLKARADMLGLTYHPSIGVEKLREKITTALADKPADPVAPVALAPVAPEAPVAALPAAAAPETEGQARQRMKREATALVRIRITCMNPAKKDWEGEIITVGNNLIGTIKKFVPFNSDEGWHVTQIMYDMLKERQCQIFVKGKTKNGQATVTNKMIKEFAIEILDPLTPDELKDLAQRQAMAKSID